MPRQLTPRQRRFASEYIRLGSGRAARLAAGYSPKSAAKTVGLLLRDPRIQALLASSYTPARAISDVEAVAAVAAERGDAQTMLAAVALRAQLAGLLVQARPTTQDMVTQ